MSTTRSRRTPSVLQFVVLACGLLVAACSASGPGRPQQSTPPPPPAGTVPNIVFVLTDDLSTNLLRYMPNVAALAKQGTSFTNYFVVDSLCCPSRSAIFTGQFPHNNGVFTNHGRDGGYHAYNDHGDPQKSFAVALHHSGYRTGMMGKYLNQYLPEDRQPIGWDEWDVAGNGYGEFDYQLNENGDLHRYGHRQSDYLTDVLSAKAARFVDGAVSRKRPFALEVATFAPHLPATPAPRDARGFPHLTAPRSRAFDRTPTAAPRWLAAMPPLSPLDQRHIDEMFRQRVRSVQAVDAMVGALRRQLQAKGLADNTYFVFSSDNGFHMGEHRLLPGKQTAFDTDIRVPLIVAGPGVPAGRTVTAMTSSIDLAPTFEDLAGAQPTGLRDGRSLVPLLHGQGPPADWQQAVLVEHHGPTVGPGDPDVQPRRAGDPPSYEAIRTATSLYVEYATGEREYYDLRTDPAELHNLVPTVSARRLAPFQQALHRLETCRGAGACGSAARIT
jgi:arylsulfatase A-like enzyme